MLGWECVESSSLSLGLFLDTAYYCRSEMSLCRKKFLRPQALRLGMKVISQDEWTSKCQVTFSAYRLPAPSRIKGIRYSGNLYNGHLLTFPLVAFTPLFLPAMTAVTFLTFPDTLSSWPWPRTLNPHYAKAKAASDKWLAAFHCLDPQAQNVFDACDFGEYNDHPSWLSRTYLRQ